MTNLRIPICYRGTCAKYNKHYLAHKHTYVVYDRKKKNL